MGPRGSGKSTWLRTTFPDAHVIDLLAEETYQRLLASPGLFADELRALTSDKWVIVDEVQSKHSTQIQPYNSTSDKIGALTAI